jgi:hypothetical protein
MNTECQTSPWGRRQAIENFLATLFVAVPIVAVGLNAISWLTYGTDLPCSDDWADYVEEDATSVSFGHLFAPGNDTFYPVGRALDSFAQINLRGNSVVYQLISMLLILGTILGFQWHMLRFATKDKFIASCAFVFAIFSIQPNSYWGFQNNAYIQGIPILCLCAILYLLTLDTISWRLRFFGIVASALISGLSYISGAAAEIGISAVMIGYSIKNVGSPRSHELRYAGFTLLAVGVLCILIHGSEIVFRQGGALHRADASLALPTDLNYWLFQLGKIGRALALPSTFPGVVLPIVLFVTALLIGTFAWHVARVTYFKRLEDNEFWIGLVFCSFGAATFVYLNLAAAGRAKLRPSVIQTPLDVFAFGFENRSHFFWVTLLWPWCAALPLLWLSRRRFVSNRRLLLAIPPAILLPLCVAGAVFDSPSYYRSIVPMRAQEISCLQAELEKGQGINCPIVWPQNLARAFVYARSIGSSFTRYFPILPFPIGSNAPGILFRLSSAEPEALRAENILGTRHTSEGWEFDSDNDPQTYFKTDATDTLQHCLVLQVSALVRSKQSDISQFFARTKDQQPIKEVTRTLPIMNETDFVQVDFLVDSLNGFSDEFRFDPVSAKQPFTIQEIEVRCRLDDHAL